MALLGQGSVADPRVIGAILALEIALFGIVNPMAVRVIDNIVEISDALLSDEVAQDIYVAVGL